MNEQPDVFKETFDRFFDELAKEEMALEQAEADLIRAQAKYDVASWKYAAVRDMLAKHLGRTPYEKGIDQFIVQEDGKKVMRQLGRYRFINMAPGDAVITALEEVGEPLSLQEIVERLMGGHIAIDESRLKRAVNAALMNTKGIQKTEDGKYVYEELPF